jgi:hypothetical protein
LEDEEDILAHIATLQGKVRDVKDSLQDDEFSWNMPGPDGDVDAMPVGLDGGGSIVSAMTGFDDGFGANLSIASESKDSPPPAARKTGRESKGYK